MQAHLYSLKLFAVLQELLQILDQFRQTENQKIRRKTRASTCKKPSYMRSLTIYKNNVINLQKIGVKLNGQLQSSKCVG